MNEETDHPNEDEGKPSDEKRQLPKIEFPRQKLEFLDYVALTIALLQTVLVPFLLLGATLILLYASFLVLINLGPLWLIVLYAPLVGLIVLTRRFLNWRRLRRIRASLR